MGLFGDILSLDDIPTGPPRADYLCQLSVNGPLTSDKDDPKIVDELGEREFYVLEYTISDKDEENGAEWGGVTLGKIYIDTYPNFKGNPDNLSDDAKNQLRNAVKFFRKMMFQMGVSDADIKSGNVDLEKFDEKYFWVGVWTDKLGNAKPNTGRIKVAADDPNNQFESLSVFNSGTNDGAGELTELSDLT